MRFIASAVTALLITGPAAARIEFEFEYVDRGTGFDDPLFGAERRAALEQAAAITASFFPRNSGTVRLRVDGSVTEDSTLASAGSRALLFCNIGFDNLSDVLSITLRGTDPTPSEPDGEVSVNFEDFVWDLDDDVSPRAFDFKSTLIHELLHALGFSGSLGEQGRDMCGGLPPQPGVYDPFDRHLGDASGPIIDSESAVMNASRWSAAVVGGTGNSGLLWHGEAARAANNGMPVPLYSPQRFSPGSSISHLDDDFYVGEHLLMESAVSSGPATRSLSAIERGILRDLGYGTESSGGGSQGPPQLSFGTALSATLGAGATDVYVITVSEPGLLLIESSGSLDLLGELQFNGQSLVTDDDRGENRNFSIQHISLEAGEYRLLVRGFDGREQGGYSLLAQFTRSGSGPCFLIDDDDGRLWNSTIRTCAGVFISAEEAQLYRAYRAAFARTPDLGGYNWWLAQIRSGRRNLGSMLRGFLFSREFLGLVNAPNGNSIDNAVFLNHVYRNVFGRAPDPGGFAFYMGLLESGERTQARVLEGMSQSNEFVELTAPDLVEFIERRNAP